LKDYQSHNGIDQSFDVINSFLTLKSEISPLEDLETLLELPAGANS